MSITDHQLEQHCLGWFGEGGWEPVLGPHIAHDGATPERANYREAEGAARFLPLLQSPPPLNSPV